MRETFRIITSDPDMITELSRDGLFEHPADLMLDGHGACVSITPSDEREIEQVYEMVGEDNIASGDVVADGYAVDCIVQL